MIHILLVGIGGYGAVLYHYLTEQIDPARYEITAIVDPYRATSPIYPEVQTIPAFDDLEAYFTSPLFSQKPSDLALIATPIGLHRPQTVSCLQHGLHVLCEKPPCALLSDLDLMSQAARDAQRLLAIGFQWSFYPEILAMKDDLLNERFGRVLSARSMVSWPRSRSYYESSSWKGRIRTQDGTVVYDSVLSNATAHYLHNLLFLLGPSRNRAAIPETLSATLLRAHAIESFDTVSLKIGLSEGREILYLASHAVDRAIEPRFEIRCERGSYGVDLNDPHPRFYAVDENGERHDYSDECYTDFQNSRKIDWILRGAETFQATRELIELPCDAETARPHLTVINALMEHGSIHTVDPQHITVLDNEVIQGPTIQGLPTAMEQAYESGRPLSDVLPFVPQQEVAL